MSGISPRHLRIVERWTLVLAAIASGAALVALPRAMAFACAVGAGLMCLNAAAIRWLTERAYKSAGGPTPGLGLLLFNVKMALLVAAVAIALFVFRLDGIGFILGISVFPVAAVCAALSIRLEPGEGPAETPPPPSPNFPHNASPSSGDR